MDNPSSERLPFALRCLRLAGLLPLPLLHAIGAVLGVVVFLVAPRYRRRLAENLKQSLLTQSHRHYICLLLCNAMESGKGVVELLAAWSRPPEAIASLVRAVEGWETVEATRQSGRGLLFVTPHLGSYDIAGRWISTRLPLMAMYRPPKLAWLAPLMNAGRARAAGSVAATDSGGVRKLLKTLRSGGAIIVLPDQVPGQGDGEWAPFFGRPAYTMTLLPRLAESTGAIPILCFGERLSWGRGYVLHFSPWPAAFSGAKAADARIVNEAVESLVRQKPEQYLWSYNRYKTPAGAKPTPSTRDREGQA